MSLENHGKKKEEQWVKEQEQKLIEEMKKKREARIKERQCAEEAKRRKELKELHYMHCPKCGFEMKEVIFEEIKIDKCSFCEGIYFDRGELEELLQKKNEEKKNFFRKLIGL
ncbi:MAG: zf-TFIIB domain-containing protein [Acidobacteria bacterium]|nr:zf-TFIIB domain-containing protein [Acidobacteriota bacterium]